MARYTGPRKKYEKRFGLLPDDNAFPSRGKRSDFGKRLEEKQKLKFIYGLLEKQFRGYYSKALNLEGNTEEHFARMLELRLDNIVYRLGFANTRSQARQLVSHGHVLVDGRKVDIPSYQVSPEQTITLKDKTLQLVAIKENLDLQRATDLPAWLSRKGPVGKVNSRPTLEEINLEVDVSLIIEYYSR